MSDFNQILKSLDYVQASKDTTRNLKPLSYHKARAIKKLHISFTIPAYHKITFGLNLDKRLVAQFNCIMPEPFHIIDMREAFKLISAVGGQQPVTCIKWRFDQTVYRYILFEDWRQLPSGFIRVNPYEQQRIPKHFVIEYWKRTNVPSVAISAPSLPFITNLYRNPETPEEVFVVLDDISEVQSDALFHAFPEPLPTEYGEESAWLNNV